MPLSEDKTKLKYSVRVFKKSKEEENKANFAG